MKLIIQIPCLNEERSLPVTLAELPRRIEGVDCIEFLVIDDGSTDRTSEVARAHGVHHIVRFPTNRGLAAAFRVGVQACLDHGADIIVNTDADNQYQGADIEKLVRPIVEGRAEMVIGDRQIRHHAEFGPVKKWLQAFGSRVVSQLARTPVPDVTSGFRAFSRTAAMHLNVLSSYTYTHETIIQAGLHNLGILSVPISVNPKMRPSRLFSSIRSYLRRSGVTILRIYTLYKALKVFTILASVPFVIGVGLGIRFLYFYLTGQGAGHIQSLILCTVLLNLSFMLFVLGVLADLIGFNRRLLEDILFRSKQSAQPPTSAYPDRREPSRRETPEPQPVPQAEDDSANSTGPSAGPAPRQTEVGAADGGRGKA